MGMAAVMIAVLLVLQQAPVTWWLLMLSSFLCWPQAARICTRRSSDPGRAEMRNLLIDAGVVGIWPAMIGFSLIPTAILLTTLLLTRIQLGIAGLCRNTLIVLASSILVSTAMAGFDPRLEAPLPVLVASLPLLAAYPLIFGFMAQRQMRFVHHHNRELDRLNRTDALTGLSNRGYWHFHVGREWQRRSTASPLGCMMALDIDRFKHVNDQYGHALGDELIRAVSRVIVAHVRSFDVAARLGGDEFAIVLFDCRCRAALHMAEAIRQAIEAISLPAAPQLRCAVSIGVAEASPAHRTVDDWMAAADAAMYRAKKAGRNRVAGPVVDTGGGRSREPGQSLSVRSGS